MLPVEEVHVEAVLWSVLGLTILISAPLAGRHPRARQVGVAAVGVLFLLAGALINLIHLDRVDLAEVLVRMAADLDVAVIRVDSGGQLVGALMDAGLLDELSLLVHPVVAGSAGAGRWWGAATRPRPLALRSAATEDGGLVWLRHSVESADGAPSRPHIP